MKKFFRILLILLITLFILLGAIFLISWIYQDELANLVKEKIGENMEADVDFDSYSIRLFKHFPDAGLALENLLIKGRNEFDGDTLLHAEVLDIEIDLKSLIYKPFLIESIELSSAMIHPRVLEDGMANWDIFPEENEDPEIISQEEELSLQIGKITAHDLQIKYSDLESDIHSILGKIDLAFEKKARNGAWESEIEVSHWDAEMESLPLLTDATSSLKGDLYFDLDSFRLAFGENTFYLNEMQFALEGEVAMPDTSILMDLQFNSTRSSFKDLLSMIPFIYRKDFPELNTKGDFHFDGNIVGIYDAIHFPKSDFKLQVSRASFSYPSLPKKVADIDIDLRLSIQNGEMEGSIIDLKKCNALLGGDPFNLKLLIQNPGDRPLIDMLLQSKLNLANWKDFLPLESQTMIEGLVEADIQLKGVLTNTSYEMLDQMTGKGSIEASQLSYQDTQGKQALKIEKLSLDLTPENVSIKDFRGRSGQSDLSIQGKISQYLPYILKDEKLVADIALFSNKLDINEWTGEDDEPLEGIKGTDADSSKIQLPKNIKANIAMDIAHLIYDDYDLKKVNARLRMDDGKLEIDPFITNMLGGKVEIKGTYDPGDSNREKAMMDLRLDLSRLDLAESVKTFTTVQSLAPIANRCSGDYSASLQLVGDLMNGFSPDLTTLDALLHFKTDKLMMEQNDLIQQLGQKTGSSYFDSPTLSKVDALIKMEDGYLEILPFDTKVGEALLRVSGKQALNKQLDYKIAFDLPSKLLLSDSSAVKQQLFARSKNMGLSAKWPERIRFDALISGELDKPSIKIDLKDQLENVKDIVKEEVMKKAEEEVEKVKTQAILQAEKKAKELLDAAEKKGNTLLAQAEKQVAKIKGEADNNIDRWKKEADKRSQELIEKAGNNPVKKIAAQEGAKLIQQEAQKKANDLKARVDKESKNILAEAEQQKRKWIDEARKEGEKLVAEAKK